MALPYCAKGCCVTTTATIIVTTIATIATFAMIVTTIPTMVVQMTVATMVVIYRDDVDSVDYLQTCEG